MADTNFTECKCVRFLLASILFKVNIVSFTLSCPCLCHERWWVDFTISKKICCIKLKYVTCVTISFSVVNKNTVNKQPTKQSSDN